MHKAGYILVFLSTLLRQLFVYFSDRFVILNYIVACGYKTFKHLKNTRYLWVDAM